MLLGPGSMTAEMAGWCGCVGRGGERMTSDREARRAAASCIAVSVHVAEGSR